MIGRARDGRRDGRGGARPALATRAARWAAPAIVGALLAGCGGEPPPTVAPSAPTPAADAATAAAEAIGAGAPEIGGGLEAGQAPPGMVEDALAAATPAGSPVATPSR